MKRSLLVLALMTLVSATLIAQETLFTGELDSGGFGGPVVKVGTVNGETGLFVGGRGGWIINHSFIVGGGGYGLVNDIKARVPSREGLQYFQMGYGGLELEYISEWEKLIHLSLQALIGGGGVHYKHSGIGVNNNQEDDLFFFLEPAVHANLNVTGKFVVSLGISYRYISGVTLPATSNTDLGGPTAVLTFRFGKF